MWKALVGFIVFAAIALFFIFKAGDKMDMAGEAGEHGAASASVSAQAEAPASVPAPAASVPATSAASAASASK